MNVLILFEESGKVMEAFRDKGHSAFSVDLLPTRSKRYSWAHMQADVWERIDELIPDTDLIIAFPPCTYLCVSGNRHYAGTLYRKEALNKIRALMELPVDKIAIENPVGVISSHIRKPDQIIQPWQFGHPESKRTCLWLKGLPKLQPTSILPLPESGRWNNQTPSGQNKLGPSADRARLRSETYDGVALAMAQQWG